MRQKLISILLCICICIGIVGVIPHDVAAGSDARAIEAPLRTIEILDVPRYMGTWFEITKYPNRFQKQCVGYTTADYRLQSDGKVQVINRCRLENGEASVATGAARQVGASSSMTSQ